MKRQFTCVLAILTVSFAVSGSAQDKETDLIPEEFRPLVSFAKDISAVYSGATDAIKLLQLLGIIPTDPSAAELFRQLDEKLVKIAGILVDLNIAGLRAGALKDALTAASQADRASEHEQRLPEFQDADFNSEAAVRLAFDPLLYRRFYDESKTHGFWNQFIRDRPDHDDGKVYDWRYNVPFLMYTIGLRLKVMTAIHPEWRVDGHFDRELRDYAKELGSQLQMMLAGVKCGARVVGNRNGTIIGPICADIHTGISGFGQSYSGGAAPEISRRSREVAKSEVLRRMPIFEMQSMINTLNFYLSHAPDLTADLQRIPLEHAQNLCVDVQGGNPAAGTPVWLMPCNGNVTQTWVYNRTNGQIRNPWANKCLDVQYANPVSGTPVWIWDCNGTPAQEWTYDPVGKVLQSALGTVLGTRDGNVDPQIPIEMTAVPPDIHLAQRWQRWHADRPINDQVLFLSDNFETIRNTDQCPAGFVGKFQFDGALVANAGSNQDFSDIVLKVDTLTNGNLLLDTDQGPGGVGVTVTYPSEPLLLFGHSIPNRFVLCLRTLDRFEFKVDVYGGRMPDSRCAVFALHCLGRIF